MTAAAAAAAAAALAEGGRKDEEAVVGVARDDQSTPVPSHGVCSMPAMPASSLALGAEVVPKNAAASAAETLREKKREWFCLWEGKTVAAARGACGAAAVARGTHRWGPAA